MRDVDVNSEDGTRHYFDLPVSAQRRLGEVRVSGDQMLAMVFGVGERIIPNHAWILLLCFRVIDRDIEAEDIRKISSAEAFAREKGVFLMAADPNDDETVHEFVAFFHAMFLAWKLNVPLFVDA